MKMSTGAEDGDNNENTLKRLSRDSEGKFSTKNIQFHLMQNAHVNFPFKFVCKRTTI